jgi:hypothetical protein
MSATCQNCKSNLSCGCQRRTASDGSSVCTMCLNTYEIHLKQKAALAKGQAPSNVTVLYTPARK